MQSNTAKLLKQTHKNRLIKTTALPRGALMKRIIYYPLNNPPLRLYQIHQYVQCMYVSHINFNLYDSILLNITLTHKITYITFVKNLREAPI